MQDNIREKSISLEKRLKSKLFSRMPGYIFSNDLFESWVKQSLNPGSVWIDAGCGKNSLVYELEYLAPDGTGIDSIMHPELVTGDGKFINANLEKIPMADSSVDTIIANMVVEHIGNIDLVLKEFNRILKKGGNLIFRTTNKWYPALLAGNFFPKKFKDKIIYKIFGVKSHDIFETFYHINTLWKINKTLPGYGFKVFRLETIEDLHLFNPVVFELSYMSYKIQKLKLFKWLRNCIVCWAIKK